MGCEIYYGKPSPTFPQGSRGRDHAKVGLNNGDGDGDDDDDDDGCVDASSRKSILVV